MRAHTGARDGSSAKSDLPVLTPGTVVASRTNFPRLPHTRRGASRGWRMPQTAPKIRPPCCAGYIALAGCRQPPSMHAFVHAVGDVRWADGDWLAALHMTRTSFLSRTCPRRVAMWAAPPASAATPRPCVCCRLFLAQHCAPRTVGSLLRPRWPRSLPAFA